MRPLLPNGDSVSCAQTMHICLQMTCSYAITNGVFPNFNKSIMWYMDLLYNLTLDPVLDRTRDLRSRMLCMASNMGIEFE